MIAQDMVDDNLDGLRDKLHDSSEDVKYRAKAAMDELMKARDSKQEGRGGEEVLQRFKAAWEAVQRAKEVDEHAEKDHKKGS